MPPPSRGYAYVFMLVLSFRLLNALAIRTFFSPDQFYQLEEPAWLLTFGPHAGAYITWVSSSIQSLFVAH